MRRVFQIAMAGAMLLYGVAVTAGQFVSASDISSGLLVFTPASNGEFAAGLEVGAPVGQTREFITSDPTRYPVNGTLVPYWIEVTLSNPYTYRATALATIRAAGAG